MPDDSIRPSFLAQASAAGFLLNICQWGFAPLYPDMAEDLGIGADAFSALVSLPSLMNALLVIPVGRYVDRFGASFFLLFGALTLAAALILRALADGVGLFAFAQFIFGFTWPCFMQALVTAVLRRYPAPGRAEALGWVMSAGFAGQAVGYVVLGLAGAQLGWRATSFAFAAAPLIVAWVVRKMGGDLVRAASHQTPGGGQAVLRFLLQPAVAALAALAFTALVVIMGSIYLLPFALRDRGMDSAQSGMLIAPLVAGMVISAPLAGRLAERYGASRVVAPVLALAATGLFTFALLGAKAAVIVPCYFLVGLAGGCIPNLVQTRFVALAERTGALGAGVAVGCARLAQAVGVALGPAAVGVLYVRFGLASALSAMGVLLCVCTAAAIYGFEGSAARLRHTGRH